MRSNMSRTASAVLCAALLASGGASATPPPAANHPHPFAAAAVSCPSHDLSRSSVHDRAGQRFDVPPCLLRKNGTMINGIPPEAMQFE